MFKKSLFFILLTLLISSAHALEVNIHKMRVYNNKVIINLEFDTRDHLGANEDNWIGVYKPNDSNEWENVIDWAWIKDLSNGIAPGDDSGKNRYYFYDLPEGSYELRFFENNSYDTSASFAFETSEALDNPKIEITAQTESTITFHATYVDESWIGIYKENVYKNDWEYVKAWSWVDSDNVQINLENLERGDYVAKLFYNNSYKEEKRVKFSHNGVGQADFIEVKKFNGYSRIDLSSSFQAGKNRAWVGLYKKGASNAVENQVARSWANKTKTYLNFSNLDVDIYELRLFYDNSEEPVATTELNVDGKQIFRTDKISFGQHRVYDMYQDMTYFAPMNDNDWVGLFKKGAEREWENLISWGRPYLDHGHTNRVVFKTPGKVGKYELVYFINDTYEQVGKSIELEFN